MNITITKFGPRYWRYVIENEEGGSFSSHCESLRKARRLALYGLEGQIHITYERPAEYGGSGKTTTEVVSQ